MTGLEKTIENFQDLLISQATGGGNDPERYQILRREVLSDTGLKKFIPPFIKSCRSDSEFWQFIKAEYGTYAERRRFIWDAFRPMFDYAEGGRATPSDESVSIVLEKFDSETIHGVWTRAMERRESDPEGAITLARTLLEAVCKHILDEHSVVYDPDSDLPGLYKLVAKTLNIAPSQHSEQIFKQILGGCTSVVEGLGALRNRLSDAHGQGKKPVKPAPRHAELAVNLSGAVATYLVSTHQALAVKIRAG